VPGEATLFTAAVEDLIAAGAALGVIVRLFTGRPVS
jgi:hypothetical protein